MLYTLYTVGLQSVHRHHVEMTHVLANMCVVCANFKDVRQSTHKQTSSSSSSWSHITNDVNIMSQQHVFMSQKPKLSFQNYVLRHFYPQNAKAIPLVKQVGLKL